MKTSIVNNALQEQINTLTPLKGFLYTLMVDGRVDFLLASVLPQNYMNVEKLVAQAATMVRRDIEISEAIGIPDETQSIIFTSENEVRIFYKLHSIDNHVFIMLVLEKSVGNVAMALHQLRTIEPKLKPALTPPRGPQSPDVGRNR